MQKRFTNQDCIITCGSVIGHRHVESKTNCQDSYAVYCGNNATSGVIVDGCSSSPHAEISALISKFVARYAFMLHKINSNISISTEDGVKLFLHSIFKETTQYVNNLTSLTLPFSCLEEQASFINEYLMGVIVGFYIDHTDDKQPAVIYSAGDPIFSFGDNNFLEIDQNNKPLYLMYNCISPSFFTNSNIIGDRFHQHMFNLSDYEKFMISSDGFNTYNSTKIHNWCRLNDEDTFDKMTDIQKSIHGQQWNKKRPSGLQMWLNKCSRRGYFDDDTTLITVERVNHDQESDC